MVYAVSTAIAFAVMRAIGHGDASMALLLGAILSSQAAALIYHRRQPERAPVAIKAAVGAVLVVAGVGMGLLIHTAWLPIEAPDIVIPIAAIGSFFFPFVLFETLRKTFVQRAGQSGPRAPR